MNLSQVGTIGSVLEGSFVLEKNNALDFHGMFDNSAYGIIVREAVYHQGEIQDMRNVYVNRFFKENFGFPHDPTLFGKLSSMFADAEEQNSVMAVLTRVIQTGQSQTVEAYSTILNKYLKIYTFSPCPNHVVSVYEDITARKQLEQHIEEVGSKSLHLTDCIDEVFWVRSKEKILYVNPAYEKIIGLPLSSFHRDIRAILEAVHPEDRPKVSDALERDGLFPDECLNIEFRTISPSGGIRWLWLRTFVIRDFLRESGNKAGSIIDITERKQLSEELSSNYMKTSTLFDFLRKCSQYVELDDILLSAQNMIMEHLGIRMTAFYLYDPAHDALVLRSSLNLGDALKSEIAQIPMGDSITSQAFRTGTPVIKKSEECLIPPELIGQQDIQTIGSFPILYGDRALGVLDLFIRNGSSLQYVNQEFISAICSQLAVLINNALLYEALKNELERRRTAEQEVELVFNTAIDLLAIIETNGIIRRLSPGWVEKLGWHEHELIGKNFMDYIDPDDREKVRTQKDIITQNSITLGFELRILGRDGSNKCFAWNAHWVQDQKQDLIIAVGRDVSQSKEMEAKNRELEKAMQMEAVKMEFFANISHEFRTPLNIIISALQLIEQNMKGSNLMCHSKAMRHLNSIKQNSFRLLRLVSNLIDITKLDTGYFKIYKHNYDIVSMLENITQSVAQYIEGKGLNLIFDTDVEEKVMACDAEMVERIMLNLLSNAVKYTEKNGYIKVTIKDNKDCLRVSVRDTGVGIPEDKRDLIFERFVQGDKQFTRRCEGSGIGLSLVKSMVELHGGRIWVNSTVGKGSDFIFELPFQVIEEDQSVVKNLEPTHEERIQKVNVEFSDIYTR
jgi:PAS domain S-box-containing protein